MLATATQLLPAAQQLLRVHDAGVGPGSMLGLSQPPQVLGMTACSIIAVLRQQRHIVAACYNHNML